MYWRLPRAQFSAQKGEGTKNALQYLVESGNIEDRWGTFRSKTNERHRTGGVMTEIQRIEDQLRRAFKGNAWHGPAVRELLADVTAEKAAARPLSSAHSIWEIVLHMATWEEVVRRRVQGETVADLAPEQDWPLVRDTSEAAWASAIDRLERANGVLCEAIVQLDDRDLAEKVPGKEDSVYTMLHGIIQHDLYHAGQIAILKKT
jgi:uncharacterized damage-inducible protein DinB